MPSNAPDLNFGPSQRYLPGKKLLEGDVLTINILSIEKDEVDTDFGSKLEFNINVLSSSTDVVSPGKYTWRTIAAAPRKVHEYWLGYYNSQDAGQLLKDFSRWVSTSCSAHTSAAILFSRASTALDKSFRRYLVHHTTWNLHE